MSKATRKRIDFVPAALTWKKSVTIPFPAALQDQMGESRQESTLRELLDQTGWARNLAKRLVGNADSAEDVVQDAWVSALRRPPHGSGPSLRAWLSKVIRRTARKRRAQHPEHRSEDLAGVQAAPCMDSERRLELQRTLVEAVLSLDEPYREVIVQRFFEGLPPRQIAARMGLSSGTIRTRLSRALHLLRTRLDKEFGSRGQWSLSLMQFAKTERPTLMGTNALLGVSAMSAKVIGGVAAGAVLAAWIWNSTGFTGGISPSIEAGGNEWTPRVNLPTASEDTSHLSTSPGRIPSEHANAATAAEMHPGVIVINRFTKSPIQGASILTARVRSRAEQYSQELQAIAPKVERELAKGNSPTKGLISLKSLRSKLPAYQVDEQQEVAETGPDGRFVFSKKPGPGMQLVVFARGFLPHCITSEDWESIDRIELSPSGELWIELVDSVGAPLTDLFVEFDHFQFAATPLEYATKDLWENRPQPGGYGPSDSNGRLTIAPLPTGMTLNLQVLSADGSPLAKGQSEFVINPETCRYEMRLVLPRLGNLAGVVLNSDGSPAPKVKVSYLDAKQRSQESHLTVSDESGKFELNDLPAGSGRLELEKVQLFKYATRSMPAPTPVEVRAGETNELDPIRLAALEELSGQIEDWKSSSPDYDLRIYLYKQGRACAWTIADEIGQFKLLASPGEYALELHRSGKGIFRQVVQVPGTLLLNPNQDLARVGGKLPKAFEQQTFLFPWLIEGEIQNNPHWNPPTWPNLAPIPVDAGAFLANGLEPGRFSFGSVIDGVHGFWYPELELEAGRTLDLGTLAIGTGTISGRVLLAEGKSGAECKVRLHSAFEQGVEAVNKAFRARIITTGPNGQFVFEQVCPGPWFVQIDAGQSIGTGSQYLNLCAGEAVKVELTAAMGAEVRGIATDASPGARETWMRLRNRDHFEPAPNAVLCDTDGTFQFKGLTPGQYSLEAELTTGMQSIQFEILGTELLEFEFGSGNQLAMTLLQSGEPLRDLISLKVFQLSSQGLHSLNPKARIGAKLSVPRMDGIGLVVAQAWDAGRIVERTAVFNSTTRSTAMQLEVEGGSLLLMPGAHDIQATAPTAILLSIPGIDGLELNLAAIEAQDGGWLYPSLPGSSIIKLSGLAHGQGHQERIVQLPTSGSMRLSWPN